MKQFGESMIRWLKRLTYRWAEAGAAAEGRYADALYWLRRREDA